MLDTEEMKTKIGVLADMYPVGLRVIHGCGRKGRVVLDEPVHVPGVFHGKPTAWCFSDMRTGNAMVCVAWDNEFGFDRWLVWVPLHKVRPIRGQRENRPALAPSGRAR
ncbi:hypothetical protein [Streptomyces sp. CAU 1734]|uniref:hypothetical protein n=1 Tax=Streptomyces sp. CAU 1734 TaxID=3140360 RepID=UPI003261990F